MKFADEWLPAAARHRRRAGDGDGPRDPQGVLRRPDRRRASPTTSSRYTDLPFLVTLEPSADGALPAGQVPHRRRPRRDRRRGARSRPCVWDARDRRSRSVPNGSLGLPVRRGRRRQMEPRPRRRRPAAVAVRRWRRRSRSCCPASTTTARSCCAAACRRAAVAGQLVTTVFDLMLAQYGVARPGLPGQWPTGYDDAGRAVHPGVAGADHRRAGRGRRPGSRREFADNAERSGGRSMILMGAGTNHWFHSDTIYRAMLALTTLTGCQGVNGGGWAHYVGQEKCRPVTGWSHLAFGAGLVPAAAADDRHRVLVPAHRPVALRPLRRRRADLTAGRRPSSPASTPPTCSPSRPGWAGCRRCPTFDRNPLDVADEASPPTRTTRPRYVVDELTAGRLRFACTDPDAPRELAAGADRVAGQPARLVGARATSTSCATCWAPTRRCAPPRRRRTSARRTSRGATRHRRASSTCCCRWTSG